MKNKRGHVLILAAVSAVLMHGVAVSAEIAHFEALSALPFAENRPTPETDAGPEVSSPEAHP